MNKCTCSCINKSTYTYIVVFVFRSGWFSLYIFHKIFSQTVFCDRKWRNFNLHLQNRSGADLKWLTTLFTIPKVYKYSYLHQSWIILIAHQVFGLSWDDFWINLSYLHVHNTILKNGIFEGILLAMALTPNYYHDMRMDTSWWHWIWSCAFNICKGKQNFCFIFTWTLR